MASDEDKEDARREGGQPDGGRIGKVSVVRRNARFATVICSLAFELRGGLMHCKYVHQSRVALLEMVAMLPTIASLPAMTPLLE